MKKKQMIYRIEQWADNGDGYVESQGMATINLNRISSISMWGVCYPKYRAVNVGIDRIMVKKEDADKLDKYIYENPEDQGVNIKQLPLTVTIRRIIITPIKRP